MSATSGCHGHAPAHSAADHRGARRSCDQPPSSNSPLPRCRPAQRRRRHSRQLCSRSVRRSLTTAGLLQHLVLQQLALRCRAAWPDPKFGGTSTRGFDARTRDTSVSNQLEYYVGDNTAVSGQGGTQSPLSHSRSANDASFYFPQSGVGGENGENGTQPITAQHHPHDTQILLDEGCRACLEDLCTNHKFSLPPTNRYCCAPNFVREYAAREINCRRFEHLGEAAVAGCLTHKSDWNICANLVLEDLCVGCQDRDTDGATGAAVWIPAWSGDGSTDNTSATVGLDGSADPYPDIEFWAEGGGPYAVGDVVLHPLEPVEKQSLVYRCLLATDSVASANEAPDTNATLWRLDDRTDGWYIKDVGIVPPEHPHGTIVRDPPDKRVPAYYENRQAPRYIIRLLELLSFSPYYNASHFVAECFAPTTSPLYHERQGGPEQCLVSLAQQLYIKTYNISHVVASVDDSYVRSNGIRYATVGEPTSLMGVPTSEPDGFIEGPDTDFYRTDPGALLREEQDILKLYP
jgi:hypothetical protein